MKRFVPDPVVAIRGRMAKYKKNAKDADMCEFCDGSGYQTAVPGVYGMQKCYACNGTGESGRVRMRKLRKENPLTDEQIEGFKHLLSGLGKDRTPGA